MVTEATVQNNFKKSIEQYKTGRKVFEGHNRGGYPIKTNEYDIPDTAVEEIQSRLKYGTCRIEFDGAYTKRIYFWYTIPEEERKSKYEWPHITNSFPLKFTPCKPEEITQVDKHHTYGTTMDTNGASIEKILKQSEKAIYCQMVKDSGFRYARWLPKCTIYIINREIDTDGVISSKTNLFDEWVVEVDDPKFYSIWGHKEHFGGRDRTYGDEAHYKTRIANLIKEGGRIVSESSSVLDDGRKYTRCVVAVGEEE